jgi:multidrug efflux system outer membrane protein
MRRGAVLLVLALSSGLAACAGPRPGPPPAASFTPPAIWRTTAGPAAPIAADWWQALGDPVLTGLIARALAANDDLAIAATRVEEARAGARLARAQLSPQIGGNGGTSAGQALSPFGTASDAVGAQPGVTISYDLDLFGRLRQAGRAAAAQALASEGARDTVRLAVVTGVATGYVTLRGLDARLAIARSTLAARAEALRIARRRFEVGYSSRLELRQAEADYRATEVLIPQAELAIRRQEDSLSLLLGDNPGPIPRGAALDRLTVPPVPGGLPADLLRRRPDLWQAEQTLVAADRSLDSARAALLPNVTLTGSAGVVLSTALANPVGLFSLGGSVLAPLFDAGRVRAQADAAAARRDAAAFGYRRAALTAFREVEDSLAGVTRAGEQATVLEAQRTALAGALVNATERYRAGYSPYLEQLDAQRGLLSADLALVQARIDRLVAAVTLYQAMGGGWTGSAAR